MKNGLQHKWLNYDYCYLNRKGLLYNGGCKSIRGATVVLSPSSKANRMIS